jgi:heterodisulfide reductase subunit A
MTDEKKNSDSRAEHEKVGIYICYCGGNISDHVDVETVRARVEKLPEVSVARTNMFMCSDPGQELIMNDLKTAPSTGSWWPRVRPVSMKPPFAIPWSVPG